MAIKGTTIVIDGTVKSGAVSVPAGVNISGKNNADGFACKLHSGEGNYFESCIAEYNSDDGWDCYAAHGKITLVNCQANYNGYCDGIYGDGNGFKMGGVDNKTEGVAAHLDPLDHTLTGKPSALGYEVTFGKAIIQDCVSKDGSNNIKGATLKGTCVGF